MQIANGAQTVGAISRAFKEDPGAVSTARVHIRIITLKDGPADFDVQVTRSTNTQNRVDRRDFAALDSQQKRLKMELAISEVEYVYKSGEDASKIGPSFDLEEATVSLVCQNPDLGLTIQAKREIGKLWDDINKAPYQVLFNGGTNAIHLWRGVQAIREIERTLEVLKKEADGKDRGVAVHGNRFIEHLVIQQHLQEIKTLEKTLSEDLSKRISEKTILAHKKSCIWVAKEFPEAYPASLFKNQAKCNVLKARISQS